MTDQAAAGRTYSALGRVSRALDATTDGAVVALAVWTVLYHLGLLFDISAVPLFVVSVLLSVAAMVALARLSSGDDGEGEAGVRAASGDRLRWHRWLAGSVVLAVAAAVAAAVVPDRDWWVASICCTASALLLAMGLWVRHAGPRTPAASADDIDARELVPAVVVVLLVAIAAAVLALLVIRPNADDIYYVNRSAWVAQHGSIPLRDTMFGNGVLPAFPGAGIPLSSIEALQGVVARVLHITAGSVVFEATPVVATLLAVWALWRLVRAWAPRRAIVVFGVAILYLVWGGTSERSFGNFHFVRDWQGKAIFVSMLVPLAYVYLTRWWNRQDQARCLVLCGAAGVAAVGLTSSATFLMPLLAVGAALPVLWSRSWRLLLAPGLALAYPVLCGVIVNFTYSTTDAETDFAPAAKTFHEVAAHGLFAPLTLLALLLLAALVREGAPARVALGTTLVAAVLLTPGVLELIRTATGAAPVLWRVLWVAPIPVAVGLLAAAPVPDGLLRGFGRLLPTVAVVVVILAAGLPVLARSNGVAGYGVAFKLPPRPWRDARAVLRATDDNGNILAPAQVMSSITTTTTRVHVVNPRTYYTTYMDEPPSVIRARFALALFANRARGFSGLSDLSANLRLLDVGTVCLPRFRAHGLQQLAAAGYSRQVPAGPRLVCAIKTG